MPSLQSAAGGFFLDGPLDVLDLGAVTTLDSVFLADTNLTNVNMFCNLTTITEDLGLRNNTQLQNLGGFANLVDIGGTLSVFAAFGDLGQPNVDMCEVRTLLNQTGASEGSMQAPVPAQGCPLPDTCSGE